MQDEMKPEVLKLFTLQSSMAYPPKMVMLAQIAFQVLLLTVLNQFSKFHKHCLAFFIPFTVLYEYTFALRSAYAKFFKVVLRWQ